MARLWLLKVSAAPRAVTGKGACPVSTYRRRGHLAGAYLDVVGVQGKPRAAPHSSLVVKKCGILPASLSSLC